MTDNDDPAKHIAENCRKCYPEACTGHNPGRDLGASIAKALKNKDIQWAMYNSDTIYPHGAKDAGDLTDEEITTCIKNSVSDIEYTSKNVY